MKNIRKVSKTRFLRLLLSGLLCTGLVFSQIEAVSGIRILHAEEDAEEESSEDMHTEAYSQPPDTNSVKDWPQGPNIEAQSAVLMDMDTKAILYSKNADQKMYPASITKIMTTYLACQRLPLKKKVVVSDSAAYGNEPGSSSIYAEGGEEFTATQALMAVMLESANEMAVAVAETVSGSTKKFVELMNQRAALLGCTGTHFNNPNGLPDENHYTTAGDMAKIATAAWSNARFRRFVTTDLYEIPPTNEFDETRYLLNHHKMMPGRDYAYEGVLGGKTGYTDAAGSTLVTYASRNGLNLAVVVMGSINGAWSDTAALLDYGFQNFEKIDLGIQKAPIPVKLLPCEKHILKDNGYTYAYYYTSRIYATVPIGTDKSVLTDERTLLSCCAGPCRVKGCYYFNGQMVGQGMQYSHPILPLLAES